MVRNLFHMAVLLVLFGWVGPAHCADDIEAVRLPRQARDGASRPETRGRGKLVESVAELNRIHALVRDSGLLAEVFEQHPEVVLRCHADDVAGVILVAYVSGEEVVGWAMVRNETILGAGKGIPSADSVPETDLGVIRTISASQVITVSHNRWLDKLLPRYNQTGLLCLALVVVILIGFDFRAPSKMRNLDLLGLFVVAVGSLSALLHYGSEANTVRLVAWSVIMTGTVWLLIRSLVIGSSRGPRPFFEPNIPVAGMVILLVLVGLIHFERISRQEVGGAGLWSVRGAQHILSRNELPYGKLGDGDCYGPLLYAAHIPAVMAFPPTCVDPDTGETVPWSVATDEQKARLAELKIELDALAETPDPERSPVVLREELVRLETDINRLPDASSMGLTSARLMMGLFDALILLGIVLIGTRWANLRLGLSAAVVYGILPYTIERLAHVSTLLPVAMTVWAVVLVGYPFVAGLLLALGTSASFFPVFLFPLWFGYYAHKGGAVRYLLAFLLVGATGVVGLWLFTDTWSATQFRGHRWPQVEAKLDATEEALKQAQAGSPEARGLERKQQELRGQLQSLKQPVTALTLFIDRTVLQHEGEQGTRAAGAHSFWAQVRAAGLDLGGGRTLIMLLTFALCVTLFFVPTHKTPVTLVALSAAVLISTQLWKVNVGGLATWYAPLLVLSFMGYEGSKQEQRREKFIPLQDVKQPESDMPAIEEIDAELSRREPRGRSDVANGHSDS